MSYSLEDKFPEDRAAEVVAATEMMLALFVGRIALPSISPEQLDRLMSCRVDSDPDMQQPE